MFNFVNLVSPAASQATGSRSAVTLLVDEDSSEVAQFVESF